MVSGSLGLPTFLRANCSESNPQVLEVLRVLFLPLANQRRFVGTFHRADEFDFLKTGQNL